MQNRKRDRLTKGMHFHQDKSHPQTTRVTTDFINKLGWNTVTHPPYSLDVTASNYHPFPELKKTPGRNAFQKRSRAERRGFKIISRRSGGVLLVKHK
ncbi:hypothetical protein Trydic_g16220 [Trypoxylus dichotomus]